VLGPEAFPLALEMLTETAVTGCLTRYSLAAFQKHYAFSDINIQSVQEEILRVLEHDGYIKTGKDGFVFDSHLLRDWWNRRYRYFHVPVLERRI
jgi:hypothetical protein